MEQFDQLLTCCVCLDRYRNPKLLPCQHSFCMEPCMEGLVDYVRRQVKCPECRAEHRIPYQGVQAFPTNVTLQRFLELHIDLTGELPDPTSNQIMERCQVCSEKSYCNPCAHCDKKVCPDCKDAHLDVLKREITRLSSQVRRVLHRLEDALSIADKNLGGMKGTHSHILDEVDDLVRRFTKAIKDKGETIRHELESYVSTELTTLNTYKSNLETEISNIQSNCDLVDKHVISDTTTITWDDQELMDTKDLFLKTIEFIRNFEYEPGDRRIRFTVNQDPNTIIIGLNNFGELVLPNSIFSSLHQQLPIQQLPAIQSSPGIMRSKSDHRLVQQYRDMDDLDDKPTASTRSKYSKYGSTGDGEERKFRSRFTRRLLQDDDDSRVRFNDGEDNDSSSRSGAKPVVIRARVIETDDAVKGPLSGVFRLLDSTRVLEKMVENDTPKKKPAPAGPTVPLAIQQQMQILQQQQLLQQQHQQQQQNQPTSTTTTASPQAPWRQPSQEKSNSNNSTATSKAAAAVTTPSAAAAISRKQSAEKARSESESSSSEQNSGSSSSSSSSSHRTGANFTTEEVKQKYLKGSTPQKSSVGAVTASSTASKSASPATSSSASAANKFRRNVTPVSSTLGRSKEDESESSSEESETESEDSPLPPVTSSSAKHTGTGTGAGSGTVANSTSKMERTDIGPLLARSANVRDRDPPTVSTTRTRTGSRDSDNSMSSSTTTTPRSRYSIEEPTSPISRVPPTLERRVSRDEGSGLTGAGPAYTSYRSRQAKSPPERTYGSSGTSGSGGSSSTASRYGTSSSTTSPYDYGGLSRSRTGTALYEPESATSRLQSKYMNRSRHNLGSSLDQPDDHSSSSSSIRPSGNPYYTGRSSYLAKQAAPTTSEPRKSSSREKSKDKSKILSRSKSTHDLTPGEPPNIDAIGKPEDEQASLSSWARYLKSKYGKTANAANNINNPSNSATESSNSISNSNSLNNNNSDIIGGLGGSGLGGSFSRGKSTSPQKLNLTASQYSGKKRLVFKFGARGSESGHFTWPRGIACGPDGSIVVADSSNHRIQVFDPQGNFIKDFGMYGNGDGEFDCLAGVAVNRIGQFIVSDRYNHRIQVFDPSGRFLRSFGSQGSTDGKFNYPWGVTTDALGFIYVCDKENHRVQVFQSDGTFVGKFGVGELEHPHYIGVTCTNKVVVSDTGHHRVFIFDVNGKVITSIGTEGIDHGQFKLPRGVAVDEQGYIFVGDSGNNRIQIFNPDGIHIKSFGGWGSGDGEFKGLEGIAVNSSGNVLVCDRENHRIQVF